MPEKKMGNAEILEKLLHEVRTNSPDLEDSFVEDADTLVKLTKGKIQILLGLDREQDIDSVISSVVKSWRYEKLMIFAYPRYLKLMEAQGFEPISFMAFNKPSKKNGRRTFHGNKTPYQRFRILEQRGIKIGDRVKCETIVNGTVYYTLRFITPQVLIRLENEDGELSTPQRAVYHYEKA